MRDFAKMRLTRRAALLGAAALPMGGCSIYDTWFGDEKAKLPGKRIAVIADEVALVADAGVPAVRVPAASAMAEAAQAGGGPAHAGGHMQARETLQIAWSNSIGAGSGYRQRLTAPPVVSGGRVFAMDSDARVTALDATSGGQVWRAGTRGKDDRSTNVGGGIAVAGDTLYAATGRADIVALDAATGEERWRQKLPAPARSAPTVADGRIYVSTLDDTLVAVKQADGAKLWTHQAPPPDTATLGLPAPLATDGLVVAGFSSGELRALRGAAGTNAWGDNLAAARGKVSLADIASIRGMPASVEGRVYAGGLGRLLVGIDLRSGRRLWEREASVGEMPWIAGGWLFIVTVDGTVAALDRSDGRVAWSTRLERWEDAEKQRDLIVWTGPVLAGGKLYLASSTGVLAALDPVNGAVLGRIALSAGAAVAPVPAMGALFVVTADGNLTCLR